jgi:hypothetical protein
MIRVVQSGHPVHWSLSAVLAAALAMGCASASVTPAKPGAQTAAAAGSLAESRVPAPGSAPERHVGDLFVHRFSGSFAPEPLTLTEEVTAREDSAWVVDFSLTQNDRVARLRVRFDIKTGAAVSAARLDGSRELPATLRDYEALMARTVYAADVNDGLVSTTGQTCLVGADEQTCETKTYKVWLGDRAATLAVAHSSRFADRDVSGELVTDDGKLVYRAELIEARPGMPSAGVATR